MTENAALDKDLGEKAPPLMNLHEDLERAQVRIENLEVQLAIVACEKAALARELALCRAQLATSRSVRDAVIGQLRSDLNRKSTPVFVSVNEGPTGFEGVAGIFRPAPGPNRGETASPPMSLDGDGA